MKPLPKQARARQKRRSLITAAQQCFVADGFDVTTAKSIAEQAGVATGTFYQYFDNKEDILRIVAAQRMTELDKQLPEAAFPVAQEQSKDVSELFLEVLELIYQFHQEAPELHQVLEQRRDNDPALAEILDAGEAKLQERVLAFVRRFNPSDAETIAFNLFAMAEGIVHRHVFREAPQSKQQTLKLGAEMLASYFKQI
ncbi:MAG: TetR/AcrR family transcriptional regulator [Kangiellaceae bacterium]|nr:TetR/AcrR family transcriptional regulator [Kangiellaceae bacterium]